MDKVIEKTYALKKGLDDLALFKEYKTLKEECENSIELKNLKKEIVRAKNEGRLDDHKSLLEAYNTHPMIINLNELEAEVRDYLKEVADILNK